MRGTRGGLLEAHPLALERLWGTGNATLRLGRRPEVSTGEGLHTCPTSDRIESRHAQAESEARSGLECAKRMKLGLRIGQTFLAAVQYRLVSANNASGSTIRPGSYNGIFAMKPT
jgi:hypothetical protein